MAVATSPLTVAGAAGERLSPPQRRVAALDRLRGLLVVLAAVVLLAPGAIAEWPGNGVSDGLLDQLRPSPWHGVTLADLLPTGFLFVLGIGSALSVERRRQAGQSAAAIAIHLLWRCAALFAIGLILDGGVLEGAPEVRWLGPWQRVAVCNLCVGGLCLAADGRFHLALAILILVNYGLAFEMFPADSPRLAEARRSAKARDPGLSGPYSHAQNVAARVDQGLLPGRKYFGSWDPDGLLTTLPALAVTLLGAAAVPMLRRERGWLAVLVGMGLINAGVVLTEWQPANAWLLTPAFVLIATGVWGLACAALGLLPGGGGAGRGEPPEPCAPGETAKLPGVSKPADGEAREEGARPAGGGSGFSVCPLGRNALPTMLALCLFARFGVPAVAWLAGKSGIPRLDFQTIVAISGLIVLEWWRRWLSRRNWQVSL